MTRARLALIATGLLAAAASLAYVRTTDSTTHACLYWGPRTVHYRVNYGKTTAAPPVASPTCTADAEITAVSTAFQQWTGAVQSCTDLNLVDDGVPGSAVIGYQQGGINENTVVFRSGWCSVVKDPATGAQCPYDPNATLANSCANRLNCFEDRAENGQDTLALTTTTYSQTTGQILDADMELNGWDGGGSSTAIDPSAPVNGWYFTCGTPTVRCVRYGDPSCIWIDVQNTVTHEAGHFIGLAHPCGGSVSCAGVPMTTMYPYAGPGDTSKRKLTQDDVNGLCAIYPAGKATVTCASSPKGGCATGEGAGFSALLLGAAALLPRLRRRRA
jgi:hypothetical protein